jgi:O-antigen ligase
VTVDAAQSPSIRLPAAEAVGTVRSILFVATLALSWITVRPFVNLADPGLATLGDSSDLLNQFAYVVLAGAVLTFFLMHDPSRLRPLLRPAYLAMLAWFAITIATSTLPALSMRRLIFCLMVIVLAATLTLLPTSYRRFCDLLAATVVGVLLLCFAGVMLIPELSIHQATDVAEAVLGGDWRGVFGHKNIAGPMMVIFIFIGMFIASARSITLGLLIVAGAAIFLFFTHAKAATGLLLLVLPLSWIMQGVRSRLLCALVIFGAVFLLNLLTVGSMYSESIYAFDNAVMADPTFTGRTDIWRFAIDNIRDRPLFGHGFGAFWETPYTYFQPVIEGSEVAFASHSHSGFLDLALTIGIPGLALGLIWTLLLPFRDYQRCREIGADSPLTALFLRIWMFGIFTCSFESLLFNRGDPTWFTMLAAMFGLRYLSLLRVR